MSILPNDPLGGKPNPNEVHRPTKAALTSDPARKPPALTVNVSNIPAALRQVPRWVVWSWKWNADKRKWDKPPCNARTGAFAKSNDPTTWSTFADAMAVVARGEADGVGLMLGDGWAGVDLDECRNLATTELDPWAVAKLKRFPTYAEVSPSGTGIKLLCRGKLGAGRRRAGQIELYSETRYFTVTGHRLPDSPLEPTDCQAQLEELQREITPTEKEPAITRRPSGSPPDDAAIINKAKQAKDGPKFAALWEGDWSGYPSQSEADQALCNKLCFWLGPNADAIDRHFRQSGLYRQKWERQDYRKRTIDQAIAGTTDHYGDRRLGPPSNGDGRHKLLSPPPDGKQSEPPCTAAKIILAYFHERYQPVFRRGATVHCHDGSELTMQVACVGDEDIIELLTKALDVPRYDGVGAVKRHLLPGFFRKWASIAWGTLLKSLPEELDATLDDDAPARETFVRLVREALFTQITFGDVIAHAGVAQTERRSLIGWCVKFAKAGPWRDVRSLACWCKSRELEGGELKLQVAIRHELFAQVGADRRLREIGGTMFARLAAKYGVGESSEKDRPHGRRAIVLADDFVDDLTTGIQDDQEFAAS